jgi:hypothetical protein
LASNCSDKKSLDRMHESAALPIRGGGVGHVDGGAVVPTR